MTAETMTCTVCGETKNWRDGFPSRTYAICWKCSFDQHIRNEHPLTSRKHRRAREKLARARAASEIRREEEQRQIDSALFAQALSRSVPKENPQT